MHEKRLNQSRHVFCKIKTEYFKDISNTVLFLHYIIIICQNYWFVKHLTNVVYIIEYIIQQLYCCGYNGYEDWEEQGMTIPLSCPSTDINKAIYVTGCIERLSIIIHRSALYIGTGAVAIALIQVSIYYVYS